MKWRRESRRFGEQLAEIFDAILNRTPVATGAAESGSSGGLEHIIGKALEKDKKPPLPIGGGHANRFAAVEARYGIGAHSGGNDGGRAGVRKFRRRSFSSTDDACRTGFRSFGRVIAKPRAVRVADTVWSCCGGRRVGVGAWLYFARKTQALTEKDTIVLSDFTNTTGDAIFDEH